MNNDELIFGKDPTQNIVSMNVQNSKLHIFREVLGVVSHDVHDYEYWAVGNWMPKNGDFIRLNGDLPYRYLKKFKSEAQYNTAVKNARQKGIFYSTDLEEGAMIRHGLGYFKGMKVGDVSRLFFDLETTTLNPKHLGAKILMISNTFVSQGHIERKLFAIDDYKNDEVAMLRAWCIWVLKKDPSIISGFNINLFDFPYLIGRADMLKTTIEIGRDSSEIKMDGRTRELRKDGSQSYSYRRIKIFGREVIDVFFLAIKYDVGRKYSNYKLKSIVKEEGLEIEGRQHYDAGSIRDMWDIPEEREKIKTYGIQDSDDAMRLYELMIPAFFYLTQSIPKRFQVMLESATGSQLNAFLLRSYLQIDHSIPMATAAIDFEGGISFGNPGIYQWVFKIDIASLYPSIMLEYKVGDKKKDPLGHFQKSLEYFTMERLKNKKLGKETGDRYYKDLDSSQKIAINSMYGFMGAENLNFNSPENAAFVTRKGRELLQVSIDWAKSKNFKLSIVDTDSIAFSKSDGSEFTNEEQAELLAEINSMMPSRIRFEHDGYFEKVIVFRAKNYVLYDGKKIKIKGSGLRVPNKEIALKECIDRVINSLLGLSKETPVEIYESYVEEILTLSDISRWSCRKTVTKSILNPIRLNEEKVLDAIGKNIFQEGDKIRVYFSEIKRTEEVTDKKGRVKLKTKTSYPLKLEQDWAHDHSTDKLLAKLYRNMKVFENVLDMSQFPNYSLKKNKKILMEESCTTQITPSLFPT